MVSSQYGVTVIWLDVGCVASSDLGCDGPLLKVSTDGSARLELMS